MQRGELSHKPIMLNELNGKLNSLHRSEENVKLRMSKYLKELEMNGEKFLNPPWPGPDKDDNLGNWIWSPYSPERLLERISLILNASMTEYISFVDIFFKPLAERLTTYRILPAKLTGYLDHLGAGLLWYFDPLPMNENSFTDLQLDKDKSRSDFYQKNKELHKRFKKMRPSLSRYFSSRDQILGHEFFGPTPVTDLVYYWLKSDLSDISWIS